VQKVYVVNKGYHDLSDAKRFGELTFLTEGSINRYNVGTMLRTFVPLLKSSTQEDYILVTGLTVMNIVACVVFAIKHEKLNLLLYKSPTRDGQQGKYMVREIDLRKEDL
jgi:hypothetical protein